jgi:hypothetical protein
MKSIMQPTMLNRKKVAGKIILCCRGQITRQRAGAVGMILANDITTGNDLQYDPFIKLERKRRLNLLELYYH